MNGMTLHVGNTVYRGWKGVTVKRGIRALAGKFEIEMTEKFPGQPERWAIEPGAECKLRLGNHPVITGYVDRSEREIRKDSHRVFVAGRDKAGDLVDCSVINPSPGDNDFGNFPGKQDVVKIATMVCRPFGIKVRNEVVENPTIENAAIEPGETVWEFLQKLESAGDIKFTSDGRGNLKVVKPAGDYRRRDGLKLGENILEARFIRDDTERFSRYICLKQTRGTDTWFGEHAAHQRREVEDPAIRRHRPHVMVAPSSTDLATYAGWLSRTERGLGRALIATVVGWEQNGRLWNPNELVRAELPVWGVDSWFLVTEVKNVLDERGQRTVMSLEPPEAHERGPLPAAEPSFQWGDLLS